MKRSFGFIRRERLYILLLIFVMLVSAITVASNREAARAKEATVKAVEKRPEDDQLLKRRQIEDLLQENKPLAVIFTITSLLILLVLFLGLVIDVILFSRRFSGRTIDIRTSYLDAAKWGVWDVGKVAILFLFFGYMLVIIESVLIRVFPIIKNDDLRMVFNSSVLDTLTIVFILYFTVVQYKEKLRSVGIAFKNFSKNVFYGIIGYVATLPLLFLILIITAVVANFFKYVPKEQVVVELFMRQDNPVFLIYTSVFAAIAGPIVEELFFRGFMYTAVKKHVGIFWAAVISAAFFAGLHAHPVGFLPIMVLGILLAYLYEKTGTLVSSITVHMIHNFSMVLLVFMAKSVKGM
ncbi:MAG: CPBP family intramembrane metalloprotease [Candidatus Omnitrophica bacterium]|nr:CPBP family intramembrane metalloprotease [Candidatus Omnitrophota bacterium]